jgi:biopolymer transport protein ExbD
LWLPIWKNSELGIISKKTSMAEISQNAAEDSRRKIRAKKMSTRIDMTPMVDLAFLLLTFFILTSTFIKPMVMSLGMPDSSAPGSPVNDENVLNLVLAEGNKVYWWDGLEGPVQATNYSSRGVREVLLRHKTNRNLIVLIKPTDESKYENIVDVLDEVTITNTERYAIVDFTPADKAKLNP